MRNHGTPVRLPALLLALTLAGCAGQGAPSPAARSFSATITSTDRPLALRAGKQPYFTDKNGQNKAPVRRNRGDLFADRVSQKGGRRGAGGLPAACTPQPRAGLPCRGRCVPHPRFGRSWSPSALNSTKFSGRLVK